MHLKMGYTRIMNNMVILIKWQLMGYFWLKIPIFPWLQMAILNFKQNHDEASKCGWVHQVVHKNRLDSPFWNPKKKSHHHYCWATHYVYIYIYTWLPTMYIYIYIYIYYIIIYMYLIIPTDVLRIKTKCRWLFPSSLQNGLTFWLMRSWDSPSTFRRSECPSRTQSQPMPAIFVGSGWWFP